MTLDSAMQIAPLVFSDTYLEARQKFLTVAPNSKQYPCSTKGPFGEALFTDVAYFGHREATKLLVLVSATHGAEGYCGSAAQLLFFHANFHEALPPSTGVLLIHALNCYGFAWDRKVTAEGCNLNRNFVDFSKPLPANPGYQELAQYFDPEDISPEGLRCAEAAVKEYRSRHGERKFQEARKSGQYIRPGGMYYGGMEPTESRRTLEKVVADYDVLARDEVIIIDYHTGLGAYGYGEPQCEQPSGRSGYERAVSIFGPSVTSLELATSSSVVVFGSQDDYWQRILADRHTYIALEFGTYDADNARKVQRDEYWLFMHRPEEVGCELGRRIRNTMKRHYYPQRPDWQEMVVWRSHQVLRQALDSFASRS